MSIDVVQPAFTLDRDTALKIALAARIIPNISAGGLIEILQRKLGNIITSENLKLITVTDLKTGFASADGEEDGEDIGIGLAQMKEAVRILWGDTNLDLLPEIEEPLPASDHSVIQVAVASNEGENLDGHFGSCIHFLVYQLSLSHLCLVDIRSTLEAELAEDKNFARAEIIKDCDVLYVQSIGGPAAAKVVRAGIYPIKVGATDDSARQTLLKLQQVMQINPPPWLAKIMGFNAEERVRFERSDYEGE